MNFNKTIIAMTLALASQAAHATIVSGTNFTNLTGSEPLSTPSVGDPLGFGWDELTGVTLGSLFSAVDTNYGVSATTLVNSHWIGYDPLVAATLSFTVTFDQPILGVIWTTYSLDATEAALGLPTVTYYTPKYLGLEPIDGFTVSGNTLTFTAYANIPGDFMRVLTSPIPEPSVYPMMGLGLACVMLAVSRKRRSA